MKLHDIIKVTSTRVIK